MHAVEKFGKSSWAANAPGVIFGMGQDETGLLTLIDAGRVPKVPYFPPFATWTEVQEAIESLTNETHPHKVLALDTMNSLEKLCHQFVCDREFKGDWGNKGFANYKQGYEVSLPEWTLFLNSLDKLRATKRMGIILLAHTKIAPFKSPDSADYDRYSPDLHPKTWGLTHKWADAILFGNFYTEVVEEGSRHKGKGGQQRMLYTVRHAAYDAGNRYGLPEEIDMGESGKDAWDNFAAAMKSSRAQNIEQQKGAE